MALTPEQQTTLAADIDANSAEFGDVPQNSDGAFAIADAYNELAAPTFTVWRTSVSTTDIRDVIVWTEYRDTAVADKQTFELMISNGVINPSHPNVRQGIADIFSGPNEQNTLQALTEISKRAATRAEALFATGDGLTGTATMTFEGSLSYRDVQSALGW